MSQQVVISAKEMAKLGFKAEQIVVSQGYVCPDCGGHDPACDYCAGNGHGFDTVKTVFTNGSVRLGSYSHEKFVADCRDGGRNDQLFYEFGLYGLKYRLV